MTNFLTFVPVVRRTVDDIRAALDADANAGLDPSDSRFIDTTPGGFYYDLTQAFALEAERLWDFAAAEVPAVMFVPYAWGRYLDLHGETLGVERRDPAVASGVVRFVTSARQFVGVGTQVATEQPDPELDPLTYQTVEGGTSPGPPEGLAATPSASGGTLATDSYFYRVTATNAVGETLAASEVEAEVTGPTGSVSLDWDDEPGATGYRIFRSTTTGTETYLASAATSAYVDTGSETPTSEAPPALATAGVDLLVEAVASGAEFNVPADSVSALLSALDDVSSVSNPDAITGGMNRESDEPYRERLLLEIGAPQGAGNVADYVRWSLAHPGVGHVRVEPLWQGPGTVRVIITDEDNNPVAQDVVDALQAVLDPFVAVTELDGSHDLPQATITVASTAGTHESGYIRVGTERVSYTGKTSTTFTGCAGGTELWPDATRVTQGNEGRGLAPIGADVTVATPDVVDITVSATVLFDDGYSLDGDAGTRARRDLIESAMADYVDNLRPGDDVYLHHVRAQVFRIRGVLDVPTLTLNGDTDNVEIAALEVAELVRPVTLAAV